MFKEKTSKKRIILHDSIKDTSTLDARHHQMIQTLQNNKNSIQDLTKETKYIDCELERLNKYIDELKQTNNIESCEYNTAWSSNLELQDLKKNILNKINNYNSHEDEIDYYAKTGYVLYQYYDLLEKQNNNSNIQEISTVIPKTILKGRKKHAPPVSLTILDAFNIIKKDEDTKEHPVIKSSLVDEYLTEVDPTHLRINVNDDHLCNCPVCKIGLICIQHDSAMVCPDCGYQELLLVEQNRPLLRQSNKEASHFSYKRINHFREWCSQVQGKESTDIPEEIFEQILQEIKKEKIIDTKKITYDKMREIMKKLKINKYYEHINYIINRINGVPTPHFSPELEEKLCSMFKEIQGPFLKHCPKERKNFLSYSYVLYKFFQILGMHKYLRFFPLLKSREKLWIQDQIFKNICDELYWEFYPSL